MATLIIDTVGGYKPDEGFYIHPDQLHWLESFQKEVFETAIIKNTPCYYLTQRIMYLINRVIKREGSVDVLLCQKISVLQDLDASEIENNAKLGGFVCIETSNHERFVKEDGKDVKKQTLLITMMKD